MTCSLCTPSHPHTLTPSHPHTLNVKAYLYVSLSSYVSKSLRHLLCIIEYICVFVFVLSLRHHRSRYLGLGVVNLSTMEEYFIGFLEGASGNNHLSGCYHSNRYYAINTGASFIVQGMMIFHSMLRGFSILVDDLPPRSLAPHHRFCNIRDFPEVLKSANVGAIPDSGHSMIILAMSTFLWGVYIVLLAGIFLLEKRLSKVIAIQKALEKLISQNTSITSLGKISYKPQENILPRDMQVPLSLLSSSVCVVMLLITIFGVYAFKNAKMGMDNFLVCVWEVIKIASVCLLGFCRSFIT